MSNEQQFNELNGLENRNKIDLYEFVEITSEPGYECNRLGQVRKVGSDKIKKLSFSHGYLLTCCNGHMCRVHRLVAETFIPNPNNLSDVDHINNNRSDNNYKNLRWVTRSENHFNRKIGNEVEIIPKEATRIDYLKDSNFENLFYYDQCFYVDLEFKIRCYRGYRKGKQKQWCIYDVNNNRVQFTTKQFLEYYPRFRSDFYHDDEDE